MNTLDSELQAKFGRYFFDNTGRCPEPRDMIMGLPMPYGWMVFRALELRAQVAENPDELHRELVLLCMLRWQALHDQVNAVSNPTGYMEGNTLDMPRNIEDRPQWYEQVYNHIVQPKACWTDPAADANINLEKACRKGKASETDRFEIPPWRREWQRRSKNKTGEEPGVLARLNLPQLIGGNFDDSNPNYVWVPLRRALDIERVFRKAKELKVFRSVAMCTAICACDQIRQWAWVNPHQLEVCTWRSGTKYMVGVIDENNGVEKMSSSGAHLFAMGSNKDGELKDVIARVGSLLRERDFDRGANGFKCVLKNSSVVQWGMAPGHVVGDSDVRSMLGLPDMSPEQTLGIQDGRSMLVGAQQKAEPWPNHSRVRETLDWWSAVAACETLRRKNIVLPDGSNDTHTAFCNVRNTDTHGALPPPTPQQHHQHPPTSSPEDIVMSPVSPASPVTLDSPDDTTAQLVSQTPLADPTAPDNSADSPIDSRQHRSGQDEENQKLSDGVIAGKTDTAAGSFAEADDIVAQRVRKRLPAVLCHHIVLPELPPLSFPEQFWETIGIDVQEPAAKRAKAEEAAFKQVRIIEARLSQQVRSIEEEKQTSEVQDAFDGGGSAGGGSTEGVAADQLETNSVMPEEKKATKVQETPQQWNQDGDSWCVEEVSSGRANRNSLSSPESTCATVVSKKAVAQGKGEHECDTAPGSPTESISSSDEGSSDDDAEGMTNGPDRQCDRQCHTERGRSSDDDIQGSPSHAVAGYAGEEESSFVPCWSPETESSIDSEHVAVPPEPTLMWYKSPEEFGMDATFAEYIGMSERALWHLLPIVCVKFGFGEHDQAEQIEYMQLVERFRQSMLVQELQESEQNSSHNLLSLSCFV
jgi:hypothetical protein